VGDDGTETVVVELAVAERVHTQRVPEHARPVHVGIDDVVDQRPSRWVESGEVSHAFGDLVVRTGGVAADTEPADDFSVVIEGNATTKEDEAAADLAAIIAAEGRRNLPGGQQLVRLSEAPQRMPWLRERVELRRRQREDIETEGIGCVSFTPGDGPASGPDLCGIIGRRRCGADLA
jgi:hypothetical protein